MSRKVDTVCGLYQSAKKVKGVSGCPNKRHLCVFGPHLCGRCGDEGHGYEDCEGRLPDLAQSPFWSWHVKKTTLPPVPPPPPRPVASSTSSPPVDGTPRSKSKGSVPPSPRLEPPTKQMVAPPVHVDVASGSAQPPPASQASGSAQPPPASQASGTSQHNEGREVKGYGKGANLGIELPRPQPVSAPYVVPDSGPITQTVAPQDMDWGDETALPPTCPPPFKPDKAYLDNWFRITFTPLVNVNQNWPPEVHDQVLWRSVHTTSKGNESGKVEFFNGKVSGIEHHDTEGTFLIVY